MKRAYKNFKEAPLSNKTIRIPLWKSAEILFGLPAPMLLFLGVIGISDGLFDTHLGDANMGMPGVITGFVFLGFSIIFFYRIIKYPGIVFTRDSVIIPPVKFLHWRTKIIPYNKIKEFHGSKFDYEVFFKDNKKITFPKHDSTNILWKEFDDELCKRHAQALKAMGKHEEAKELYESDGECDS